MLPHAFRSLIAVGHKFSAYLLLPALISLGAIACALLPPAPPTPPPTFILPLSPPPPSVNGTESPTATAPVSNAPTNLPTPEILVPFKKFLSNVTLTLDGDFIILKSDGIPPHGSPYFPRGNSLYEAYTAAGFRPNPSTIEKQNITLQIPLHPQMATTHTLTLGGPIGLALDGVPFFNQYAANRQPATQEIAGFDQYGGHPQQQGMYHYHVEPYYLTALNGKDALVGFLLDGFPVYGPEENGRAVTNNDLDVYHGHTHATADYPNGIYHYHITPAIPWISGDEFYGIAGKVISPGRP